MKKILRALGFGPVPTMRLLLWIFAVGLGAAAFSQSIPVPGGGRAVRAPATTPTDAQFLQYNATTKSYQGATASGSYTAPSGTGFPHITGGAQDAASYTSTGSGTVVPLATSPTLVTPVLGVATATSINGSTIPTSKTIVVTTDKLSVHAATSSSELLGVISDETGSGLAVFGTSPTITTPTISGAIAFPDGVRQTFNPDGTASGLNVGAQAGDPSTPVNGDIWYNSSSTALRARINGATVSLGAAGGGLASTDIDTSSELAAILTDETGTGAAVFANTPTLVTPVLGAATGTSLVLSGALTAGSSGTGSVSVGSAGVVLTDDGDGSMIITGNGNGNDEALKLDFDNTANTVVVSSSTGVTSINTGAIGIVSTANSAFTGATLTSPTVNNPTTVAPVVTFPVVNYSYLGTNNTSFGFYITGVTNSTGSTINQWEAVYIKSDGTIDKADANGSGTYPSWGLATGSITTGTTGTIITIGNVRNDSWAFTVGATVWLSTTAGALTTTQPSTTADKIQAIGKALTATQLLLRPSQDFGTAP